MLGFDALGKLALGQVERELVNEYTLAAGVGAFTLNGQSAGLIADRFLYGDAGSFLLAGQDADYQRTYGVVAGTGAFALTGQAAGVTAARVLYASPMAALRSRHFLYAALGKIQLGGTTASTSATTFALTGQHIDVSIGRQIPADAGSFLVTGQDASLVAARMLAGATGSFLLTGQDVTLAVERRLVAGTGSFIVSGVTTEGVVRRRKILAFPRVSSNHIIASKRGGQIRAAVYGG